MRGLLLPFLAIFLAVAAAAQTQTQPQPQPSPQIAEVRISDEEGGVWAWRAEVAATPESRQKGLSKRERASPMLFIFGETPERVCMWMKDTYVPLRAVFIGGDGRVIRTARMTPHSLETHCEDGVAVVLELPDDAELLPVGARTTIRLNFPIEENNSN